jgi:hypothetical protein
MAPGTQSKMDPKELKEIDKFLTMMGATDLFAYFGLPQHADADMADLAIQDRREWAQTQQANPKYRAEALWVIRNTGIVKRALVQDVNAYRTHISARSLEPRMRQLEDFIQGVLTAGGLTAKATEAIRKKGAALGLPEATLSDRVGALLRGKGGAPAAKDEDPTGDLPLPEVEVDDDPSSDGLAVLPLEEDEAFAAMPDFLAKDQSPEDELRDIVRGLALQGMAGASLDAMVFRRGKRLGLSDTTIRKIISELAKK